jgi:death-on-curing family protein
MPDVESADRADEIAHLLVRVYEIHEIIILETGGLSGLRDATMLHSAVARPFVTFDGKELYVSGFEKAGALFHSLIKSHPFMDGTKRTAFAATLYFLKGCGYDIPRRFEVDAVIEFCVSVAEENLRLSRGEKITPRSIGDIAAWFQHLIDT